MRDLLQRPDLFSINTATLGYKTPLPAIIDACAARGIGAIAPWRRELQGEDLQQIARQLAATFERGRRADCAGAATPDDRSRSFLFVHVTSGAGLV